MKPLYVMHLDLGVLDHLGINLYSNAAAVLSEAVANTWDADAQHVDIMIKKDEISIQDDGAGMTLSQINKRFLMVGYKKRVAEGEFSKGGRPFMGRKGIGKLALFSIAGEVEVHTRRGVQRNAFRMQAKDIRTAIKKRRNYHPEPVPFAGPDKGTLLILRQLKKKRTEKVRPWLRRRIARRFSVLDYERDGDLFEVKINGEKVGRADREDLKAVEFLWEFRAQSDPGIDDAVTPRLKRRFVLPQLVDPSHPEWRVGGWIGAAAKPKDLQHDSESLHGIMVLARGRPIQENVLEHLSYSRVLRSYLTGSVEADFLDLKGYDDIATSDRQRMLEDDERYEKLLLFLRRSLLDIQDTWTAPNRVARQGGSR